MKAVATLLCLGLIAGCFPHDAHKRTFAKLGEGAVIATGIGIELATNTSADCDSSMKVAGVPNSGCRTTSSAMGNLGLGLILAGVLGFVATVSTEEDDKANAPPQPVAKPDVHAEAKDLKLPGGSPARANTMATP